MKIFFSVLLVHLALLGLAFGLGWYLHSIWYLLPLILGVNLIQSAFTGVCPITSVARSLHGEPSRRGSRERVREEPEPL